MGKFGIGARVRDEDGDEGVIVGKRKGERRVQYGEDLLGIDVWVPKSALTVLDTANDDAPAPAEQEQCGFQVGDRVRFKEPYGSAKAGDEGKITGFWEDDDDPTGGVYLVANGKSYSCFRYRLEPLPVAAEAQGAGELRLAEGKFYRDAEGRKIGPMTFWHPHVEHQWSFNRESGDWVYRTDGTSAYNPDLIEEWVDAPLAIEAGNFYRTRDGRKVGPMERRESGWPWRGLIHGESDAAFEADGACPFYPQFNLVAEWVDEPADTSEPLAVAPATATPAGKFKVGDRVRTSGPFTFDPTEGEIVAFDKELIKVHVQDDGFGGDIWSYYIDELEPADTTVSADITTGSLVTLAASAKVTGFDPNNRDFVHVVLGTGGAYTLPRAALQVA